MRSLEARRARARRRLAVSPFVLALALCLSGAALGLAGPASAANGPLGFYVGASVAEANQNQGLSSAAGDFFPRSFPNDQLGWKLVIGARASRWFGGELEYLDFGSARLGPSPLVTENGVSLEPDEFYGASARSRAAAAMAVGYLPLPVRWLDVYGKLGVARLWTSNSGSGYYPDTYVNGLPVDYVSASQDASDNGLAYGAGVQSHFGALGLRLEYERISSDVGSPFMVSLGATWTFP